MRVLPSSRAMVTVRSKGILGALEHEITFSAPIASATIGDASESADAIDVAVDGVVAVSALEPPADTSRFDREKMLDNLRGKETLDGERWPDLAFVGRYRGDFARGTLAGELTIRGKKQAITLDVTVSGAAGRRRAEARWEGTLTSLGIKPFKALLGALQLRDACRITLAIDLEEG